MTERILSFDDIVSCNSLDELTEQYSKAGQNYSDISALISQLDLDWQTGVSEHRKEARLRPVNALMTPVNIADGEKQISLYGVRHDQASGPAYHNTIKRTVNSVDGKWLIEAGLGFHFGIDGLSVSDCSVNSDVEGLKEGIKLGLLMPLFVAFLGSRYLLYPKTAKDDYQLLNLNPEAIIANSLPRFVELALKEKTDTTYFHTERRSAYMAYFLKGYKPNQDKNLLCGAAHRPEVKYFFNNPPNDSRLIDKGFHDGELADRDPDEYIHYYKKEGMKDLTAGTLGMFTGALPYAILEIALLTH